MSRSPYAFSRGGHQCAIVSPPKVATNTTRSPDGGNNSTGKPANFDASNAHTTNGRANKGNETQAMSDYSTDRINNDVAIVIPAGYSCFIFPSAKQDAHDVHDVHATDDIEAEPEDG